MAKCEICGERVAELFLDKIKGTMIKKAGSKKQYLICFSCQKKFPKKEQLLAQIK